MKWLIYGIPALYLAACAYSLWIIWTVPDGLAGMLALFLAWPWSFIPGWFPSDGFIWNMVMVFVAFAINAAIMVLVLKLLTGLARAAFKRIAPGSGGEGGA